MRQAGVQRLPGSGAGMRITFILPFAGLAGGIKVAAIYARLLTRRGHAVTVVSQPRRRPGAYGWIRHVVRHGSLPPVPPATPYLDFLGERHVVLDRPRPVEDRDVPDADVVIATWWETAEWVARLAPEKGRKFYLLQDYEVFSDQTAGRVAATYALPLEKIAVSRYVRDAICSNHGVSDIHVVPNGVDESHFSAPARRKSHGLSVGFMYQTAARKNIDLALRVVRDLRRELPELRAHAFGQLAPSAEHPVPGWVDYRVNPAQDAIPSIYASCDVWLFTSTAEGFGLPILEALACGTPVIATRAGAAPDLIDGRNGVLVDADAGSFLAQLRRFQRMPDEEWMAFSRAARATALAHTWEVAADRLELLLTGGPQGGGR